MSPKSVLVLLPFFLIGITLSAQYTEKINTNRPGTSQGAFSVGNNVLQLEGGLGFGKEKHKLLDTKTNVFNFDYSVRYGLLIEQLELRLNGKFRADGITQTIGANEQKIKRSDFEVNTIGAKYLIYDPYKRPKKDSIDLNSWKAQHKFKWKSLIPAFSVYAGANFISTDNPFTPPDDAAISPKIVIMTQNNWSTSISGNWVLVTNLIVDKVTTNDPIIGWIITSTHTINDKWAAFGEYQGQKSDFYSDDIMRFGGAYLFNNDVQFDANIAFNFKDTPSLWTFSFGGSYRFDWHKKDEIIEQPGLEGGVKEREAGIEKESIEIIDPQNSIGIQKIERIGGDSESDSLKLEKTPFINEFEDDSFRDALEQDLDERRTAERLERERIENEKIAKKEDKKLRKEEARRLKSEAKAARQAEKAALQAEKEKQKMIDEIDAELDKIEKEQGVDSELENIDKELKELEQLEKELNLEEEQEKKKEEEEQQKEDDIDADYEQYQKEQEKAAKEEEKRRKKEEKRRKKEEKKRAKEERDNEEEG